MFYSWAYSCGVAGHAWPAPVAGGRKRVVPETGIEPVRLAARDFLPATAFAARAWGAVRGLEHAFTMALRL